MSKQHFRTMIQNGRAIIAITLLWPARVLKREPVERGKQQSIFKSKHQ